MYNAITNKSMRDKCHHYAENPKTAWYRLEKGWTRQDFNQSRSIHCLDQNDVSPVFAKACRPNACDWCWLGYPHTESLHIKKLVDHG